MKTFGYKTPGFTLVEMAIVLVIIGLLLAGTLMPLAAQMDQRKISETQKAMDEIIQALIGFAIANGRLPCPAPATTASGDAGAGLEDTTGTGAALACTNANGVGVLPWATLGVNELDAWGRRYTYRVTLQYARGWPRAAIADFDSGATPASAKGTCNEASTPTIPANIPAFSAFALCSQGDMTVKTAATAGSTVSTFIPAVVISHGKNGNGAYTNQGNQLATGADDDEQENQLTTNGTAMANAIFVSKTPTLIFDDQVTWLSPNTLFNRMVAAGKLP